MRENQIDTRSFREIYPEIMKNTPLKMKFYGNLKGLSQVAVQSYGCGRRNTPREESFKSLLEALKKTGYKVGDGRYLFAK